MRFLNFDIKEFSSLTRAPVMVLCGFLRMMLN